MSPFSKSAGSIVMHSFLARELCGSLDKQSRRVKRQKEQEIQPHQLQTHTKHSPNMSQLGKIGVNSSNWSISTDLPTPKHRCWSCIDNFCPVDTQRCKRATCCVLTRRQRCRRAAETGRSSERGRNLQDTDTQQHSTTSPTRELRSRKSALKTDRLLLGSLGAME